MVFSGTPRAMGRWRWAREAGQEPSRQADWRGSAQGPATPWAPKSCTFGSAWSLNENHRVGQADQSWTRGVRHRGLDLASILCSPNTQFGDFRTTRRKFWLTC